MQLEKPLGYLLGQTMRIFRNKLIEKFRQHDIDLTFDLVVILFEVRDNENMTQQDLSEIIHKDKSAILRQVNTLLDKRYLVRLPDKSDKRKKNLILTHKGYQMLAQAKAIGLALSNELLEGVSDEEFLTFFRVLTKIRKNSEKEESAKLVDKNNH
uniref:MarR family winged helix-turn-helix transcriptional regulator n=1 Tax=uncultured Draconibacterium sp. TaxID=1573823 RepID=UPI0032171447